MFLNDNQYFYVYLYWGKCILGHIRRDHFFSYPLQIITQKFFIYFFISDVGYIVTNKSQNMFFYKYFYTRAFRG